MQATSKRHGQQWGVAATVAAMVSVQSGAANAITRFASVGAIGVVALRLCAAGAFLVSTARPSPAPLTSPGAGMLVGFGLVLASMNICFCLAIERVPLGVAGAREM